MPRIAAVGSSADSPATDGEIKESTSTGTIGESRVPFHKPGRGRGGMRGGRGGNRGVGRGGKSRREDPLKGGKFNFGVK